MHDHRVGLGGADRRDLGGEVGLLGLERLFGNQVQAHLLDHAARDVGVIDRELVVEGEGQGDVLDAELVLRLLQQGRHHVRRHRLIAEDPIGEVLVRPVAARTGVEDRDLALAGLLIDRQQALGRADAEVCLVTSAACVPSREIVLGRR